MTKQRLTLADVKEAYKKDFGDKHIDVLIPFMKDMFDELFKQMVLNCYVWKLPAGLGHMYLKKHKTKRRQIDWLNTKKVNKRREKEGKEKIYVYHDNYHTDGYRYYIYWDKLFGRGSFKGIELWSFYSTRQKSRLLAKYIKESKICNK